MMVKMTSGWRKYFTMTYWRLWCARVAMGQRPLNVISVFKIELPEREADD